MVEKVKKKKCFWSWAQKEMILGVVISEINKKVGSPRAIRSYIGAVLTASVVKPIDNKFIDQLYRATFDMKFVIEKGVDVYTKGSFITLLNRFFGLGNYVTELEHPLRVAVIDKLISQYPIPVKVEKVGTVGAAMQQKLTPKPIIKKVSDVVTSVTQLDSGTYQLQLIPGIAVSSDVLLAYAQAHMDDFVKFCIKNKS